MSKKITVTVVLSFILSFILISQVIAAPPYQPPDGETYTVERGDNLSKLALRYYGSSQSWRRIVDATNEKAKSDVTYQTISDPNLILVGQEIWVPASDPNTVKAIATPTTPIRNLSTGVAITPFLANYSEGLATFAIQNRYGYIDQTGTLKIPAQFESVTPFKQGLAAVRVDNKFGYIDQDGQFVIRPQLQNVALNTAEVVGSEVLDDSTIMAIATIEPFTDTAGLVGYRDSLSNNIAIQPQFETAAPFSEGLAAVVIDGQVGYIDSTGGFVIEPIFDGGGSFREGLAPVIVAGKLGYIDTTGVVVIDPVFDEASSFVFGLACVIIDGIPGIINHTGTFIPELYIDYKNPTDRCIPEAADEDNRSVSSNFSDTVYGYKDATGQVVVKPQFQTADEFREGLARIKINNRYGYINPAGDIVIAPQYDEATPFAEGIAIVRNEAGYRVIDADGATLVVGPTTIRQINYNDHDDFVIKGHFEGECDPSSAILPDGYTCKVTKALNDTVIAAVGESLDLCLIASNDTFFCLLDFHNVGMLIQQPANANVWALWEAGLSLPSSEPPWRITVTGNIQCARRASTNAESSHHPFTYSCEDGEWILGEIQQKNETLWLAKKGKAVSLDADMPELISAKLVAIHEVWMKWVPSVMLIEMPEEVSDAPASVALPTQPPPGLARWQMRYRHRVYATQRLIRPRRFR